MKKTMKNMLNLYCCLFTITTLMGSIILLLQGIPHDRNLHIIDRAVIVLIGVITITLIAKIDLKNKILNNLLPYIISMSIVFFYVYLTSFWDKLSPNAYRDIFFNFTALYVLVAIILFIKNKYKNKNKV